MKKQNKELTSLDELIDREYGVKGTAARDEFEAGYEEFKIGVMIHEARLAKGMTQTELAEKCGTTKAYISKVENNLRDVRISTLKNIIENGLGGRLQLSIKI
ncbi:helix-turn-helix domain-containing protein [Mucilaginibacter ginsenosidivorans]|uniref:Helix-turn-helix transcriptional regulator n=1 Tax=Mucilaginibacter ginsenosidivorans TaxID=398053 RepID=A0A5B8UUH6_9SPHI|nr:helix-turn-helix transcriptional regulator [Mucilaginibacter ginsenosidivorans]QEC62593.1 helix-turn-helix transcriptional regulator [Mucilaginibacter ginsenosidivorans]